MTDGLPLLGVLLSTNGEKIACTLTLILPDEMLEFEMMDMVKCGERYQFIAASPRIRAPIVIVSAEAGPREVHVVARDADSESYIRNKLADQKVMGYLKKRKNSFQVLDDKLMSHKIGSLRKRDV